MYYLVVVLTTLVLPVASIAVDAHRTSGSELTLLIGKWFVFWGIGVRLFIAGLSQLTRPAFTAREILGIEADSAGPLVAELGTANAGLGLVGILSLWQTGWTPAAALAGGLFLAAAGFTHARARSRTRKETVAMVTDVLVALAAGIYLCGYGW
jgi:hypothetical protein